MRTFPPIIFIGCFIILHYQALAQEVAPKMSGQELLTRSIQYHDPTGRWSAFEGSLYLQGKIAAGTQTYTVLSFNNTYQFYKATRKIGGKMVTGGVSKGACFAHIDGNPKLSAEQIEAYHLACEEILEMRNYHAYLTGLPMKLKEPGVRVHPEVVCASFQGQPHYQLTLNYEGTQHNGASWQYYFDPENFALKGYRHVKGAQTSEYVVLEDELFIDGLRIPKVRKWFTEDHIWLGTDELMDSKYIRKADRLVLSRGE